MVRTWRRARGEPRAAGQVYAGLKLNFARATSGTVIYWDDMSLTSP